MSSGDASPKIYKNFVLGHGLSCYISLTGMNRIIYNGSLSLIESMIPSRNASTIGFKHICKLILFF